MEVEVSKLLQLKLILCLILIFAQISLNEVLNESIVFHVQQFRYQIHIISILQMTFYEHTGISVSNIMPWHLWYFI